MQPRLHILTLGVSDLERARRFYGRGLGWPEHAKSNARVAFFRLAGGLILALYPEAALAEDAGLPAGGPSAEGRFRGVALAQNVASEQAVRDTLAAAVAAGGRTIVAPETVDWGGYRGYFADPDGHAWEVAWNPGWPTDPDGALA
jgi:catechol 2,3-dioxygenase-like lactoylglutathione lyase family enzyme